MKKFLLLLSTLFIASACGTLKKPYYSNQAQNWSEKAAPTDKTPVHTLFLVGDAGELDDEATGENNVLTAMKGHLTEANKNSSLVFLGDNVYPKGLPSKKSEQRAISEKILDAQLALAKDFEGKTYFIPGNHDWKNGAKGGLKAIKRQEKYVEAFLRDEEGKKKVHLYPRHGCADPKVVKINKDLAFVFLDTQWWLQDWSKEKKINRGCEVKSKGDLLQSIREVFIKHKNDEIVVLMHHPIISNGTHGGHFSWKHHLFPLHEYKNLYIPLPVIGSLYPIFRQLTGSVQDITNTRNQEIMQGIQQIAQQLRIHVVFASGHDHGLQFFDKGKLQYIVSGAGSKHDYIQKGGGADYARETRGFAKVDFYENFETWLEFYSLADGEKTAQLEYRSQIRAPRPGTVQEEKQYAPISKTDTIAAANKSFAIGGFSELFLGDQYREMWSTPVKMPLINLEEKFGGLVPVKKGGGMASNSLRMQKEDGKQYILRSINKDYSKLFPPQFGNLKLLNIMKDQNSASHPYGALIIPTLSKAAGVYYTEPKLVYLKHQAGLGNYNSQFPEEVYLLEERPSGNWSDAEQFGNSAEIIGYADLLEILREKKRHFVDQKWVLKSRMFDMWIHDWDRHDDQWRWASFEDDSGTTYRPIPRDRDQAFYKFKGLIPAYVAAFIQKKFKTMKGDVKDVKNLAFNAKHFDRYFLHELEWSEWQPIIQDLQKNLTDEVIEQANLALPEEVRGQKDVAEVSRMLRSRRDKLEIIGKKLYDFLSKEVEITGTDNKDRFEVTKKDNGNVNVKYFVLQKGKDDILKYERTFYPKETKEIRLYGLRGKDNFIIQGADNQQISIRIIGGEDKDQIENKTQSGKIAAYDNINGIKLTGKIKDKTSNSLDVNEYDRNGFTYNSNFPILTLGFTRDDGFWLGGSVSWVNHGWRKDPYQSKQGFSFSVAPTGQQAVQAGYKGHFPKLFGALDFAPSIDVNFPRYENFFGLGNESVLDENRALEFNWVRMQSLYVSPLLQVGSADLSTVVRFGPTFESHDVKRTEGRVSEDIQLGFAEEELDRRFYLGGALQLESVFLDSRVRPSNGFRFHGGASYLKELSLEEDVWQFDVGGQFYMALINRPQLVLANSLGYKKVLGDPQFHQYADLGTTTHLRGFRNNRFRGESAFYHNIDLRMALIKWNNTILPMEIGILGGYDYGRVWREGESSDKWHNSQTVGLWFELLGIAILQPHYSFTDEGNAFSLRLGFNF